MFASVDAEMRERAEQLIAQKMQQQEGFKLPGEESKTVLPIAMRGSSSTRGPG